jgi:hypothetical protein
MEELKSAMEAHLDMMADLVQKLSSELRSGLRPAIDNFIGFFHAIDWTVLFFYKTFPFSFFWGFMIKLNKKEVFIFCFEQEPWLMGLIGFHLVLLVLTVVSRKHINFQMCLFLVACKFFFFLT